MPKDFRIFLSDMGQKIVIFWANLVEFRVQKGHFLFVLQCTFRHSSVKREITFRLVARGFTPGPHGAYSAPGLMFLPPEIPRSVTDNPPFA